MASEPQYKDGETECEFFVNTCHCSNQFFHSFDVMVGSLIVCDAFYLLTQIDSFIGFLLPLYFVIFGCLICMFVLYVPAIINAVAPFYFSFLGRGILFLLIGSVVFVFEDEFSVITGVITWFVAFMYIFISIWIRYCSKYDFQLALPPPITQKDDPQIKAQYKQNKINNTNHNNKKGKAIQDAEDREQSPTTSDDHEAMNKHEVEKNLKYRMDLEVETMEPIDMETDTKRDGNTNTGDKHQYGVVAEKDDLL